MDFGTNPSTSRMDTLTQAVEGKKDYWLMKATVVAASSPNIVGDYAFHKFRVGAETRSVPVTENSLQVLDGRQYQGNDRREPQR